MIPDVVIVGAGVIGASCAWHMARAGLRVRVLDRAAAPGGGSTARATGGFRAQYSTAINIRLSLLARERLRAFHDDTGVDPGFVAVGYLWLAGSAAELAALREANALQVREGLSDACLVTTGDIAQLNPHVATADVLGGAWCPSDGVIRPLEILRGYLAAPGVELCCNEPVIAVEHSGDRVACVITPHGAHAAGMFVNAAGPWAAAVGQLAGVDVPVVPLRRQVAVTEATAALPATMPLTIWLGDGFHARVRGDRVLLLRPTAGDPDPWSDRVDPAWLDDIATRAPLCLPALAGVPLDRPAAWAGLYEMTPDHHALLGFAPGCPNLLLATGCSGHGVMHAPALGLLAAELATAGHTRTLDAHLLRPSRFAEGQPIRGSSLL
ncbi:MAG: FAD-dependent oxidoreductase [Kofleriaceae bacterium]